MSKSDAMHAKALELLQHMETITVQDLKIEAEKMGIHVGHGEWAHIMKNAPLRKVGKRRVRDQNGKDVGRLVAYSLPSDEREESIAWAGIAPFNANTRTAGRYR